MQQTVDISRRPRTTAREAVGQALQRWNVTRLAKAPGLSRQSLQNYLGGRRMPSLFSGLRLADTLGVSYEDLAIFLLDRKHSPVRGRSAESLIRPQPPVPIPAEPPEHLPGELTRAEAIRFVEELLARVELRGPGGGASLLC